MRRATWSAMAENFVLDDSTYYRHITGGSTHKCSKQMLCLGCFLLRWSAVWMQSKRNSITPSVVKQHRKGGGGTFCYKSISIKGSKRWEEGDQEQPRAVRVILYTVFRVESRKPQKGGSWNATTSGGALYREQEGVAECYGNHSPWPLVRECNAVTQNDLFHVACMRVDQSAHKGCRWCLLGNVDKNILCPPWHLMW